MRKRPGIKVCTIENVSFVLHAGQEIPAVHADERRYSLHKKLAAEQAREIKRSRTLVAQALAMRAAFMAPAVCAAGLYDDPPRRSGNAGLWQARHTALGTS